MRRSLLALLILLMLTGAANAQSSSMALRVGSAAIPSLSYAYDFESPFQGWGIRVSFGNLVVLTFGGANPVTLALAAEVVHRYPINSFGSNIFLGIGAGAGIHGIGTSNFYPVVFTYLEFGLELVVFQNWFVLFDTQPLGWAYVVNQSRFFVFPFFSLGIGYRF
jgi:hypothetical protein